MLEKSNVSTRIPFQDLERARTFYRDKLGLTPLEERPGGIRYRSGNGFFSLFHSSGKASGSHTQMAWEVEDIVSVLELLKSRGVVFVEYNMPGLKTNNGIAEVTEIIRAVVLWGKRPHGSGTLRETSLPSVSR